MPEQIVWQGECQDSLATLIENQFDAVVCDPPYGLSSEPTITEVLTHWLAGDDYDHRGGGFMGKTWDSFVPGPSVWRQVYRTLKPGGYILCFAGTRTVDIMGISLRMAGFEIRDTIVWLHGQGFPKSKNVALSIDKVEGHPNRGRAIPTASQYQASDTDRENKLTSNPVPPYEARSEAAKKWEGWGTALKPSQEPIIVARKPLIGTVAENVLTYGTGGINIDGCRIGTNGGGTHCDRRDASGKCMGHDNAGRSTSGETVHGLESKGGRHPANLILGHSADCVAVGTQPDHYTINRWDDGAKPFGGGAGHPYTSGDVVGYVPVWECTEDCPVRLMNGQSGVSRSVASKRFHEGYQGNSSVSFVRGVSHPGNQRDDSGGASRFFYQVEYNLANDPGFLYTAKASKKEREHGLQEAPKRFLATMGDGIAAREHNPDQAKAWVGNHHPTVKPIALMRYLVRLVTPPDGLLLDPFVGSGTTLIAAKLEGFSAVGIEQTPEYVELARARIAAW
jgi:DNA methylase